MTISSSTSYVSSTSRQVLERAEHAAGRCRPATGAIAPRKLVLDAAARRGRGCACRSRDVVARADEHRAPLQAGEAEDVPRDDVVARAQRSDQHRREDERRREDRERREVVAGADAEREREDGDDDERRDDLPDAAATLALRVEALLPEDEHEHEREERQPVRLRVAPDQSPENRARAGDDLAQRERGVDAEREPAEVEDEQGGDAADPARERLERAAGEEGRSARANVLRQRAGSSRAASCRASWPG